MRIATSIVALVIVSLLPTLAHAQSDPRERARSLLAEAQAHEDAQRFALAAQTYLQLYDVMTQAGLPRASVALWTAGNDLARVPSRERDAIDSLRRFLAESTPLASDPEIARYRAEAPRLIAELEARVGGSSGGAAQPGGGRGTRISPVGPIVLSVGGAALIAGVILGAVSLALDGQFRESCPDLTMCSGENRAQYDEMRAISTAADVLMFGGGAIAVAGLVLTLVLTEEVDDERPTVAAVCTGDGCAASVAGRF
ncbi:MAG: hypothetical protein AB7S26_01780 [Sandaracinaceae bacterium]